MVRLFDFKSNKHFVASSDKSTLKVYELSNPTIYPSYIRKAHWKEVGNIIPRDHYDSDEGDNYSSSGTNESSYDGMMFFDGQADIKGREVLTKLAQHLARLRLMHGGPHHVATLPFEIHHAESGEAAATTATTGGVSKEKYEELKRTLKKKEEDLEKLREEMEEQDDELQKLKEEMEGASEKHEAELRELEEKKDEELRRLANKRKTNSRR
ncbi:unnamed protein product [Linum tenue]|uniref:Uncharacterized protein n=1 Tax=Linum tenue TaxID=586396 RepID=A0AAV0L2J4_9ROSI|nr:unnamed protein product [Linum tenue]